MLVGTQQEEGEVGSPATEAGRDGKDVNGSRSRLLGTRERRRGRNGGSFTNEPEAQD